MQLSQEDEIVAKLVEAGVLMENDHFGLASGRHSPCFVAKTRAGQCVPLMDNLAEQIARRYYAEGIDTVLAPGTGAISLGHAVARHLGAMTSRPVHCVFAMRPTVPDSPLQLKRGFGDVVRDKCVVVLRTFGDAGARDPLVELAMAHNVKSVIWLLDLAKFAIPVGNWRDLIFTDPEETENIVNEVIVSCFTHTIDAVLVEAGPDIAMGHALARRIGEFQQTTPQLVYAERAYQGDLTVDAGLVSRYLRKQQLLVVEDIVTTGGSIVETIAVGEQAGGIVAHAAALWNRGDFHDPRLTALVNRKYPSYAPGPGCPGCDNNIPINQQFGRGR